MPPNGVLRSRNSQQFTQMIPLWILALIRCVLLRFLFTKSRQVRKSKLFAYFQKLLLLYQNGIIVTTGRIFLPWLFLAIMGKSFNNGWPDEVSILHSPSGWISFPPKLRASFFFGKLDNSWEFFFVRFGSVAPIQFSSFSGSPVLSFFVSSMNAALNFFIDITLHKNSASTQTNFSLVGERERTDVWTAFSKSASAKMMLGFFLPVPMIIFKHRCRSTCNDLSGFVPPVKLIAGILDATQSPFYFRSQSMYDVKYTFRKTDLDTHNSLRR